MLSLQITLALLISHRLNVARLANIPQPVLEVAAVKSKELENESYQKRLENM